MTSNDLDHQADGASEDISPEAEARRAFLGNCAKYAAGMPPAIALLLSASRASGDDGDNDNNGSPGMEEDDNGEDFRAPVDPEVKGGKGNKKPK